MHHKPNLHQYSQAQLVLTVPYKPTKRGVNEDVGITVVNEQVHSMHNIIRSHEIIA